MTNYYRKGAELAGWLFVENGVEWVCIPGVYRVTLQRFDKVQAHIDALVAELTKKVDDIGPLWHVNVDDNKTIIVEGSVAHTEHKGPDRQMNTLKAIVDSGCLELVEGEL